MSTHNIGFYEDLTKIIFVLSSNMHLISSVGIGFRIGRLIQTWAGKKNLSSPVTHVYIYFQNNTVFIRITK